MARENFSEAFFFVQSLTSQYDGKVWPLPSGLIYAGAPPVTSAA